MASEVRVVVSGGHELGAAELARVVQRRLSELEGCWSRFRADSDITRLNTAGGDWTSVEPDTITLLRVMADAVELTGGAYDPTVLPSVLAAGYDHSLGDGQIAPLLGVGPGDGPAPGLGTLEIDLSTSQVRVAPGVAIDPGGIGKGLAADLLADDLAALRCTSILTSVGGDLRVLSNEPDPEPWTIDVIDPWDPTQVLARFAVDRGGVATSGLHPERMATRLPNGHVIDPRTGELSRGELASATVVASSAWRAEALATALLVDGLERGVARCEQAGATAIAVRADGTVATTPDLAVQRMLAATAEVAS